MQNCEDFQGQENEHSEKKKQEKNILHGLKEMLSVRKGEMVGKYNVNM